MRKKKKPQKWEPFERATRVPLTEEQYEDIARTFGISVEEVKRAEEIETRNAVVWKNNLYQVMIAPVELVPEGFPEMLHLSIKRLDKHPLRDWRHFQRIKNELVGPEHEAIELYPAESRLVDTANQYHLWVLKDPEVCFPIGYFDGRLVCDKSAANAKQRKFHYKGE